MNKAFETIAADLLALAVTILEDDSISTNIKVMRNTLADSKLRDDVYTKVTESTDSVIVTAFFNNYVGYLEWDRPAEYGKQPPIDALEDWAASNGIPTDAETLWAISYAIWRDGHVGRPIFKTITDNLDRLFETDWFDQIFNEIINDLNNFFNGVH